MHNTERFAELKRNTAKIYQSILRNDDSPQLNDFSLFLGHFYILKFSIRVLVSGAPIVSLPPHDR